MSGNIEADAKEVPFVLYRTSFHRNISNYAPLLIIIELYVFPYLYYNKNSFPNVQSIKFESKFVLY